MTFNFDPENFEKLAFECIKINDEVNIRTAVSRYYYSWFLRIRNWLLDQGFDEIKVKTENVHYLVTKILKDNYDKVGSELSASLIILRKIRNTADYDTHRSINGKTKKLQYEKQIYNTTLKNIKKRYIKLISEH